MIGHATRFGIGRPAHDRPRDPLRDRLGMIGHAIRFGIGPRMIGHATRFGIGWA